MTVQKRANKYLAIREQLEKLGEGLDELVCSIEEMGAVKAEYSIILKLDDDDINAIEDSFFYHLSEKQTKEIWNRLCRIWKDICSQADIDIATQYTIVIEPDEDGFHAFCPALKGCHTCGNTQAEALKYIQDAIVGYVASLKKHGDPVPVAQSWQSATLKP